MKATPDDGLRAEVEWLDSRISLVRDIALRALIEPSNVGKQIALEQIYQSLLGVRRTTSAPPKADE